jgi:hypothetical protein
MPRILKKKRDSYTPSGKSDWTWKTGARLEKELPWRSVLKFDNIFFLLVNFFGQG